MIYWSEAEALITNLLALEAQAINYDKQKGVKKMKKPKKPKDLKFLGGVLHVDFGMAYYATKLEPGFYTWLGSNIKDIKKIRAWFNSAVEYLDYKDLETRKKSK